MPRAAVARSVMPVAGLFLESLDTCAVDALTGSRDTRSSNS
jgi:hypothetical protein